MDRWAATIVADAGVPPGALVLDIGAGTGAVTAHLVRAGARVIAVELHPGRARRLTERFEDQPVTVVVADATRLALPHRPFRVVASPPYRISSELMRVLLAPHSRLVAADLVLQRAFVRRFVASARSTGDARRWQRWRIEAGRPLPRAAFQPPPRVDSTVLRVRRR